MASENETVEAVLRDIRKCLKKWDDEGNPSPFDEKICDRIESAWRREVEELKCLHDALRAKLKVAEDALELTKNAMCNYCRSTPEAKGLPCLNDCETLAIAKEALAAIREERGARG